MNAVSRFAEGAAIVGHWFSPEPGQPVYVQQSVPWSDSAPSRIWTTLEIDTAGVITTQAFMEQQTTIPDATGLNRFRVAACNTLDCGPATAWTDFKDLPPQTMAVPPLPDWRTPGGTELTKAKRSAIVLSAS